MIRVRAGKIPSNSPPHGVTDHQALGHPQGTQKVGQTLHIGRITVIVVRTLACEAETGQIESNHTVVLLKRR